MRGIAEGAELEAREGDRMEGQDTEAEGNAARDPRVARAPAAPTKAMITAHEVHHADYREWCPHCVAGKGVSHQHRRSSDEEKSGIEFCMDYAFMTEDGNVGYAEDIGGDSTGLSPVIVGYDRGSESLWAMVA